MEAIKKTSYVPGQDVGISIDAAATEFFKTDTGKYHLKLENRDFTGPELIEFYSEWFHKFPIVTIEDMLHEDDWENWVEWQKKLTGVVNIGDDLTATNIKRLEKANII